VRPNLVQPYTEITAKLYIDDVMHNRIVVCNYVRLAVQRHVNDLERSTSPDYPYRFDESKAIRSIKFAQLLKHSKGKWARRGESIKLEPWQQFIKWVMHGWVRKDLGLRRFSKAYIEVSRKNGKTTYAATDVLDLFFLDNEPGAEIYTAATKRDQAKLCWEEVKGMIKKHPTLKGKVDILEHSSTIRTKGGSSVIKALGADSDTEDGLNPLMGVIDEYHAHKTPDMVNVLESGMGAREQPLLEIITTAGTNQDGPCYQEERDLAVRTLEGDGPESFFCIIFTLDKDDDWTNPDVWIKANPNLGVSVYMDYLENQVTTALASPRKQNNVKTKNLNIWCSSATAWITAEMWDACGGVIDLDLLKGKPCYVAFDLANTTDLSAVSIVFPPFDLMNVWTILMKYYLPEEIIEKKTKDDNVPYVMWRDKGYLTATPGDIIDQDFIESDLQEIFDLYHVIGTGYDPWNASQIVSHLTNNGATLTPIRQGYATMSPFSKNFEYLVTKKLINHGNNPILAWNVHCTEIEQDPAGNIKPKKPDKKKSGKRIDGVIATIMASGMGMQEPVEDEYDGEFRVV
jgi:phage terminase large subunit-like protein